MQLQNVTNLPKDYIYTCLTSRSLAELFKFIGLQEFMNISNHSRIINSNLLQRKSLIFYCLLKDFDLIN